jgi:hypothetical protein
LIINNRNTPVQVKNLSDVVAIAAGRAHTVVAKSDDTVWACGAGNYGQLGIGSSVLMRNAIVQVREDWSEWFNLNKKYTVIILEFRDAVTKQLIPDVTFRIGSDFFTTFDGTYVVPRNLFPNQRFGAYASLYDVYDDENIMLPHEDIYVIYLSKSGNSGNNTGDSGGNNENDNFRDNRLIFGKDNFQFTNNCDSLGQPIYLRDYDIPLEYYELLTRGMSSKVKENIKKNVLADWGGTCYGMGSTLILMKMGLLDCQEYSADTPYHLYTYGTGKISKELNYLLNFYHLTQFLPDVYRYQRENDALIRTKDKEMLEKLVDETKKVKNGGVPVAVCYQYTYFPEYAYYVDTAFAESHRHIIIAFDVEDIGLINAELQEYIKNNTNGKIYKYRVEVYDPNVYYGTTGSLYWY